MKWSRTCARRIKWIKFKFISGDGTTIVLRPPLTNLLTITPRKMKACMLRERNCFQADWKTACRDTFTTKKNSQGQKKETLSPIIAALNFNYKNLCGVWRRRRARRRAWDCIDNAVPAVIRQDAAWEIIPLPSTDVSARSGNHIVQSAINALRFCHTHARASARKTTFLVSSLTVVKTVSRTEFPVDSRKNTQPAHSKYLSVTISVLETRWGFFVLVCFFFFFFLSSGCEECVPQRPCSSSGTHTRSPRTSVDVNTASPCPNQLEPLCKYTLTTENTRVWGVVVEELCALHLKTYQSAAAAAAAVCPGCRHVAKGLWP